MTNEEMTKAINFLLEHHARIDAKLGSLTDKLSILTENGARMDRQIEANSELIRANSELIRANSDSIRAISALVRANSDQIEAVSDIVRTHSKQIQANSDRMRELEEKADTDREILKTVFSEYKVDIARVVNIADNMQDFARQVSRAISLSEQRLTILENKIDRE